MTVQSDNRKIENEFYSGFVKLASSSSYWTTLHNKKADSFKDSLISITGIGTIYQISREMIYVSNTNRAIEWICRNEKSIKDGFSGKELDSIHPALKHMKASIIDSVKQCMKKEKHAICISIALKISYITFAIFSILNPVIGLTGCALLGSCILAQSGYETENFFSGAFSDLTHAIRDLSLLYAGSNVG